MKYQVTASEYTDLSEDVQKNYGSEKDGKHTMKVDGMPEIPDVAGLKLKNSELLTEAKDAKIERDQARKDLQKATNKKAKEDGDMDALEKSWQEKFDTATGELSTERDGLLSTLRKEKVHSTAVELSTLLAVKGSSDVLLPHIESRLNMEIKDGVAVTTVLGKDGKPSALTVDELGKEIANDESFAPVIEASRAAGGGANGTQSGGAAQTKTATKAQWADMNPSQKMEFSKDGGQVIET